MKPLRLLLLGLIAFALVLVVVITLAFTPGVQTWAARKLAPSGPELTVDIGQVNAGLNQTRVENIRVVQPGLALTIPSAEIEVGVLSAAGGKIEVKRLVAKDWILDLTAPVAPAPEPATRGMDDPKSADTVKPAARPSTAPAKRPEESAQAAFEGLFKLLELPFDLLVDGVELTGEVILPDGRAQVSITGGGIASGKDGKLALTADFKSTDTGTLLVRGDITTRMDTPRTFERIEIAGNASASGPQVPEGAQADVSVIAVREGQGETYTAALRANARDIVHVDITLPAGTAPLTGSWKLDATSADAAPFMLGQPMPEFIAKGQGTFESSRAFTQIKTSGNLDASIDKLGAIQPEFAALGRLAFTADFDVAMQGDRVRLNTLDARVTGDRPVASVAALQSIEFDPATGALTAADPSAELLRVTLDGVPLAWAKPFLGDLAVTGDDVRGTFTASASDGGFTLRSTEAVTMTTLSVAQAGQPLLSTVDVLFSMRADYSPKGWTTEITGLSVLSAGAPLLKLSATAAQPSEGNQPLVASGAFEADLPSWLAQPVAAGSVALKRGMARGSFSVAASETQQASLTLQLSDLVAVDSRSLPSVTMEARADIDASGRIDAKAPIVITRAGRKSDLTLDAVLTTVGTNTNIQGTLAGETLHVPDVMLFSALAPTPVEPATPDAPAPRPVPSKRRQTPDAPAPTPPPAGPLWAGVTGELKLAFKTLVYSKDLQATDVGGLITITPTAITLQNIGGAMATGGTLKADGGLRFEGEKKKPYALKADIALNDVEPAPILRALSPGEPSPVEGKFDLTTQLAGRAVDPAEFSDGVIGDIHLSSKGGTFKALSVRSSAIVGSAGTAATIVGAIGIFSGSSSTVKYAERARAAVDITKQLGAIKFDHLNLVVARDKKKNLDIKDLTLISPLVHLTGTGQITHVPGVSLLRQPLLVNMRLGAKNKLAADLRTLDLIGEKDDRDGYAAMTEKLVLDGSLESIGTKQIEDLIRDALTK